MKRTVGIIAAALLVSGSMLGCGDAADAEADDGEQSQQQDNQDQKDQNDNQASGEEDCEDDEFFNPAVEQCIVVEDNQNNDDNNDDNQNNNGPDINDPNDDNNDNQGDDCGWGGVQGESCRPDGGMLPGATVRIEGDDCHDGGTFEMETTADQDGFYEFDDVPTGYHELTITSGSFVNTDEVPVVDGEITDLTSESAKICLGDEDVDIAVFDGLFDDVPQLLDNMDIDYDSYSGGSSLGSEGTDLILDEDALMEYDILFIECQVNKPSTDPEQEMALANLRRFVNEGNSVYASDRAHPWINMALPEAIPFEVDSDSQQSTSPGGAIGTYTADVVSDEMYNLLGTDTVDFHFDTGGWSIVDASEVGPAGTVHFELDPDEGGWGGSGTYEGASAITTYDDPIGDGRIIYTSFHNSAQIDDTMEEILEYMIFLL